MRTGKTQVPEKQTRKRGLKFCPKCGSTDVFWAQGMPQFWSLWQCKNCGYNGALILEDGNLAAVLTEKWETRRGKSTETFDHKG